LFSKCTCSFYDINGPSFVVLVTVLTLRQLFVPEPNFCSYDKQQRYFVHYTLTDYTLTHPRYIWLRITIRCFERKNWNNTLLVGCKYEVFCLK